MEISFFIDIDIEESSKAMIGKFESPRCGGCGFETFCRSLNVSQPSLWTRNFGFEFYITFIIRPHITAKILKRLRMRTRKIAHYDSNSF